MRGDPRLEAHCDRWLAAWDGNRPEDLLAFYADDCAYSDPAKPGGLQGKDALRRYLTRLCAAYPRMEWRRDALWPIDGGYVVQYTARIGVGGATIVERGMDLVLLRDGLIVRNDVYFDRSRWLARAGMEPAQEDTRTPPRS